MVQVARAYDGEVVGLDIDPVKLAYLGDELGVEVTDSKDFESVALPTHWGGAADVVVDFLGSRASLELALRTLGIGSRLVTLTTVPGVETPLSPREMVFRKRSILGSRYATRHEVGLAAALVAAGRVRPVIGRQVGPDQVLSVQEDLHAGRLLGQGALVLQHPH
jgi:D-arabinose 1-dehydrogenase-like Zn-dependent alcohol dehydrogenase